MPFDRRSFLTTSAVVAVSAPAILRATRAGAAEYQVKLANNLPETHPLTVRMREAAAAIAKDTGG
ncbi:MAG: TRAP transporter substrate-binding protein, partial [Rhodoblastus sp.]